MISSSEDSLLEKPINEFAKREYLMLGTTLGFKYTPNNFDNKREITKFETVSTFTYNNAIYEFAKPIYDINKYVKVGDVLFEHKKEVKTYIFQRNFLNTIVAKYPIDFDLIFDNMEQSKIIGYNPKQIYPITRPGIKIWRPIPYPGYHAIGDIISDEKPKLKDCVCIHGDYISPVNKCEKYLDISQNINTIHRACISDISTFIMIKPDNKISRAHYYLY